MEFDDGPSTNVRLDINIVESRTPRSVFYYAPYILNVELPPPENDDCLSAASLVVNDPTPKSGTTIRSTPSKYCFNDWGAYQSTHMGVWYIFTGTGNLMTISTCHPETDYDSDILFMTSCASICSFQSTDPGDIPIATCGNPFGRQLTFDSVTGRLYYVYIHGATSSTTGNFQVSVVDYSRPSNSECSEALALTVNGPKELGSSVNATVSSYCSGSIGRGVWYFTIGTGNVMTFSTCHDETTFDTRLEIQDGTCISGCVSTTDAGVQGLAECDNAFGRQVTFDSVVGRSYLVYVHGASLGNVGQFAVSVVDYQAPPNDLCLDAAPLTVNGPTVAASTVNATKTFFCSTSANPVGRGIWYVMIGTGNIMTVSTCHEGTNFETRVGVQSGSCTAGCVANEVSLDIAICDNPFGKQVTFDSVKGRQYYIHVLGTDASSTGRFDLNVVDYPRPVNDLCFDATPLIVNGPTIVASTVNATKTFFCSTSTNPVGRGIWYVMIGTGNIMTVSTCHEGTNFETRVGVQSGSCTAGCVANEVSLDIAICDNPFGKQVTFESVKGRQYYIHVLGTDTSSTGRFDLNVVDYPRPVNDLCFDATPLIVNGPTIAASTVNATKTFFCSTSANPVGRGIWYVMIGTGNIMTVSTCHEGTNFETRVGVQSGSCTAGCVANEVSLDIAICDNPFGKQVTFDSVKGRQYYIHVLGTDASSTGRFDLNVVDYPRPVNDDCTNAFPLLTNGDVRIDSTVGATKELYCFRSGTSPTGRGVWYMASGNGHLFTVSTCHAATAFETQVHVQTGSCTAGCLTNVGSGVCENGNAFGRNVTFVSVPGKRYYVYVSGTTLPSVGNFGISLVDNTTKGDPGIPIADNTTIVSSPTGTCCKTYFKMVAIPMCAYSD
eukprot:scaffold14974_cov195-Amphora_coffeaeformis.AAC.33